jgi:hypothetical protein
MPIAAGYGAASPDDQSLQKAVCTEIEGGTGGDALTWVKLCGLRHIAGRVAAGGPGVRARPGGGYRPGH